MTNAAISGDNRTYSYDALGRLTGSTGPWGNGNYIYDALGNIRTKTEGSRTLVMSYDDVTTNRLLSHTDSGPGPTRTLNYDSRGNITELGALNFVYDMSDQPKSISGSASGTYKYDGNMKRVKSVVSGKTIYNVYDASGKLVHIDNVTTSQKTDYVMAGGKTIARLVGNTPTYLHQDHLGSPNTGTSSNGLVSWREQYTPFGETLTSPLPNDDRDGFTGHIKDAATGLNYMQARYYDPLIGRFLSIDPVGFTPDMPFMFGRYTYVGNDPINAIDPFGLCATDEDGNQTGLCGGDEGGTELVDQQLGDKDSVASDIDKAAISAGEKVTVTTSEGGSGAGRNSINVGSPVSQTVENDDGTISSITAPTDEVFEHEGQHTLEKLTNVVPEGSEVASSGFPVAPHASTAINKTNAYRKAKNRGYQRYCSKCSVSDARKHQGNK